ncbi:CHASE2 domain-containing protein [Beggiatoa leptomitoformis]|uniref:CHASE2 domain-containing protein n=1 Tax=Beggiatoa leptomitoformis TaxID=288004 RepID=A0A2N9YD16_9GAMM|nr:adenylate/guanylate cyclase domain-containing protein [Beggiatoa leptomitoformis]ALG69565.2 CHASE2 domain-containing protein [Beggiatoa leptomitoformis]AUI68372.1 CHASE2 domain-containing protein [Beggiatoa leptomitoformis]
MAQKLNFFIKKPLLIAVLIGHLVFLIVLAARLFGVLQPLELYYYDLMLWTRATLNRTAEKTADPRITLVWLTDEDQRNWGWPMPDKQLSDALGIIIEAQPRTIGLDIYRDLPVPYEKGADYERLQTILKNNKNIIAIKKYKNEQGVHVDPPPILQGTDQVAFNDLPIDSGGVVRRGLLYIVDEFGELHEAFSMKIARYYLAKQGIYTEGDASDPSVVVINGTRLVPLAPNYGGYVDGDTLGWQIMLTYPFALAQFNDVTLSDVLNRQFDPNLFTDKIVIIGIRAEATPDFLFPAYGRFIDGDQRVPGALIHGYITSQLLQMALHESPPMSSWTEWQEVIWIWIWTITGTFFCLWTYSLSKISFSLVGGLLLLVTITYVCFTHFIWVLLVTPAAGWIIGHLSMFRYLSQREKENRDMLMQIFSKHVSKDVAEAIWRQREHYLSAGRLVTQRLTATVLFTDLQNFTTVSERMEPQALMDWLNQYMEAMVSVVEKHNGQVNKFIGDAIMAVFGVPFPRESTAEIRQDAINAVECALEMRQEIEKLRCIWHEQGLPQIRMRVGIFTGHLVAGSLGAVDRQEYTVIGDTVNTASRLESFDKSIDAESDCRILIGEPTLNYLNNQFKTERVDDVHLKGKELMITVYRVIGRIDTMSIEESPQDKVTNGS